MATPAVTVWALQPTIEVVATLKFAVPPAADWLTVAVKVTESPKLDGLSDDVTAVVVAILLTTWENETDVEVA